MAGKSWVLTDIATDTHLDQVTFDLAQVGSSLNGCSFGTRTLRSGLSAGVDVLRVDTGTFRFDVLPTRGMSVWKAWAGDLEIGWQSPNRGPVHPQFVDLGEPSGLGFLDGFDEMFVRCGLESNGAPEFDKQGQLRYPLHGRIANRPAHYLAVAADGDAGEVTVTGIVEETRFHFLKLRMTTTIKIKPGEKGFRVHDVVENFSAAPAEMQILYHVNFGAPLLDAGSRFVAPMKTVVPRTAHAAAGIHSWESYAAPQPGFEEQVYFMELLGDESGLTQTLLKNAHGTAGVSMHFNKKQLPCHTVWKDTAAMPDGYVTGLEPGTNFPNPRTYEGEHNRVVKLPPGGKVAFDVRLQVHTDAAGIAEAEKAITALQGSTPPKIFDKPQKGWVAGL